MSWWGVQVALGDQVLQHIDEGSTRVSTGMKVDDVVGATQLEERLRLESKERGEAKHIKINNRQTTETEAERE